MVLRTHAMPCTATSTGRRLRIRIKYVRYLDYAEALRGIICLGGGSSASIVARHTDAYCQAAADDQAAQPARGVAVVPVPTPGLLAGARADLKVEVKARKWLIDTAVVCPATKSVVARQRL